MSTFKVDTLQSTSGGAVTLTNQEAAKAWMHLDGTGTITIRDSFNTSSATDVSAGAYTQTYTNGMNNAYYGSQLTYNRSTITNNGCMGFVDSTYTSALLNILLVRRDNLANEDSSRVMTTLHGDLA